MKKLAKISVFLAAILIAVTGFSQSVQTTEAAAMSIADGAAAWTNTSGEDISYIQSDATAYFYVVDDALETTKTGTAVWKGLSGTASAGTAFKIATGFVGSTDESSKHTLTETDFNQASPSSTPLSAAPTVSVDGTSAFVSSYSLTSAEATILTAVATTATTTVSFSYHVADSWAHTASATQRVKVTSTSDPAGEYATITEVASVGSSTANSTAQVFRGSIAIESEANLQGTNNDGVWAQDGDTVTLTYLDSSGNSLATDTVTIDVTAPTVSSLTPADASKTTTLAPTVTFDVADSASGITTSGIALSINGVAVSGSSINYAPITDGYRGWFVQGTSWKTATSSSPAGFAVSDSTAFNIVVSATDAAGNAATGTNAVTIDTTAPTLSSATTGSGRTTVTAVFSEALDASTIAASDFTVDGSTVNSAALNADTTTQVDIVVASDMDPAVKPAVTIAGTIADAAGNAVASGSSVTATDGIAPAPTVTTDAALIALDGKVTVTVTTDEKLAASYPKIDVHGNSGATGAGALTTSASTPLVTTASYTAVAGSGSGQFGFSIQASDGSNAYTNLTAVADETPTLTSSTLLTLAKGPIADADFDGDVDRDDITAISLTIGGTATTSKSFISAVDASARTITLSSAATAATISYKTADTVFEIDQAAPTVTVTPASGATVTDQSPFLRLVFDEDEYPGDSYKTVTITKAVLTNPDASTTDIASSFVSADNIDFLYSATDLALGAYTLTISATDSAGNALTDSATTFTVAKRTASIALRPGWNLVSIPGTPADTAVGTAIANANIDIVTTYDPTTAGGWLTAVRGSDGTFSGTLTTVDGSKGYWVHTSTFDPLTVDVPGLTAGSASAPAQYKLVQGWNLIPVSTNDLTVTTRDADDYLTGLSWSRIIGYSNSNNAFTSILPDGADTVSVGQGYWVYLKTAGTLVP